MAQRNKISLDGEEFIIDDISEETSKKLNALQFSTQKMQELNNMLALLQRAKNSYMEGLKKEMIAKKAGFLFDDE